MTDTDTSAEQSSDEDSGQSKTLKKRKWLRRFGWFTVVLVIIAFLVNGMVARKVIHHYLNQALEAQGMTGSLEIEGSVLNGFQINNLNYSGQLGIQSLSIDHAAVDYQIMQLIDFKVDLVAVEQIESTIDIAKFPPSEEENESSDWKATLETLRPLLMHPKIDMSALDLTLLNNGEKLFNWKLGSIQHESETNNIEFNQWIITDAKDLSTPEQSATIVWKDGRLEFDHLNLLAELSLKEIHFDWKFELKGNATVVYHDAEIYIDITENAKLKLLKGEIDSDDIFKTLISLGIKTSYHKIDLVLSKIDFIVPMDDFSCPIPNWNLEGGIGVKSAKWDPYTARDTLIDISQSDTRYQINIDGKTLNAPLKLGIKGTWLNPDGTKWWESTSAEVSFQTTINDDILALIPDSNKIPTEIKLNETSIQGVANLKLKEGSFHEATAQMESSGINVKNTPLPNFQLTANFLNDLVKVNLKPKDNTTFTFEAEYGIKNEKYDASLIINTTINDAPWINTLAETFKSPISLNSQLDIQWSGSGNLSKDVHQGKIETSNLTLTQKEISPVVINLNGKYNWPKSLDLNKLNITQDELYAETSLKWDGEKILINKSQIILDQDLVGNIKGSLPFSYDIDSSKKFFAQKALWDISIDTNQLPLNRLAELIAIKKDQKLQGTLQTSLRISGSPHDPILSGNIDMKSVNDIFGLGLDKTSLKAEITTEDKLLKIDGNLLENDQQRVAVDIEIPFTPHQWLEDDNFLDTIKKNTELKGSAEIKQLPLGKLSKLIPELKKIEGLLDAKAEFKGTITDPQYNINFDAQLPIIKLKNAGLDDITDISIKGAIDQNMILNSDISAEINGGKFNTDIQVDVNDPNIPIFDVKLVTDHALVYRDDVLAMRANANLNIKGTLEDATITGDIGILESLFYKDIDLIPIGVPSSSIGDVKLPSLDTKSSNKLPIPAPFDQWKLDIKVSTTDPILIRGNVGTGRIQGSVKVKGTLSEPSIDGTLNAKKVKAKLPFSLLDVADGKIIFQPNKGMIPNIEIRGKSQVGVHNVNIFAYGSVEDPKVVLSSYPPLPENEIMTLLATGATNSGLANRDVATFKTLQILLLELKQRNDRPGGNKLFSKLLSGIEDLDLKVGEENELTGEKYASATVKLSKRWYLTAQVDNNEPVQTRGLLIFALRFR